MPFDCYYAVMWNHLILIAALSVVLIMTFAYNGPQGNRIVNCANCFSQQWEWSSWQCDVHCNVQKSPYGRCIFHQEIILHFASGYSLREKFNIDTITINSMYFLTDSLNT